MHNYALGLQHVFLMREYTHKHAHTYTHTHTHVHVPARDCLSACACTCACACWPICDCMRAEMARNMRTCAQELGFSDCYVQHSLSPRSHGHGSRCPTVTETAPSLQGFRMRFRMGFLRVSELQFGLLKKAVVRAVAVDAALPLHNGTTRAR